MTEYSFVKGRYVFETEVKRSRFIATVFGETDADGAQSFVEEIKKTYPDARHNCYAYIGDELGNVARFSDDGEPAGCAGQPILEVLKKGGLKKTAVTVTRYFGGVKLGAAGLLAAYRNAVVECLKTATVATKKFAVSCKIVCGYQHYAALESYLKGKDFVFCGANYGDEVTAEICVVKDCLKSFSETVAEKTNGAAKIETLEEKFAEFVQ